MHKIFSSLSIIALSGAMFAADVNVQTLSDADDLSAAVAAAKAAYQETKNAQEIVLGDGVYKTTAELMLDFPVARRGGSGDPAKVTVEAQAVKNAQIEGTFAVLGEQNKAMRNEFMCALNTVTVYLCRCTSVCLQ